MFYTPSRATGHTDTTRLELTSPQLSAVIHLVLYTNIMHLPQKTTEYVISGNLSKYLWKQLFKVREYYLLKGCKQYISNVSIMISSDKCYAILFSK